MARKAGKLIIHQRGNSFFPDIADAAKARLQAAIDAQVAEHEAAARAQLDRVLAEESSKLETNVSRTERLADVWDAYWGSNKTNVGDLARLHEPVQDHVGTASCRHCTAVVEYHGGEMFPHGVSWPCTTAELLGASRIARLESSELVPSEGD